jgi:hypothetical protein
MSEDRAKRHKNMKWEKQSRKVRDDKGIPTRFMPLTKRKLSGVPASGRMRELLQISEAVRRQEG